MEYWNRADYHVATIVVPVGYLAWRAGQPMDLPQFKGYTYYEYLAWRKDALHQKAVEYRTAYPHAKMGGGLDMCFHWTLQANFVLGSADDRFLHPGWRLSRTWRNMSHRMVGSISRRM